MSRLNIARPELGDDEGDRDFNNVDMDPIEEKAPLSPKNKMADDDDINYASDRKEGFYVPN